MVVSMLVSNRDDLVAEVCASILSRCCEVHSQEETIEQFDPGLKLVMELLDSKLGSVQVRLIDCSVGFFSLSPCNNSPRIGLLGSGNGSDCISYAEEQADGADCWQGC